MLIYEKEKPERSGTLINGTFLTHVPVVTISLRATCFLEMCNDTLQSHLVRLI